MGLASYEVIQSGSSWGVLHDGNVEGTFETKELAFEAAVSARCAHVRLRACNASAHAQQRGATQVRERLGSPYPAITIAPRTPNSATGSPGEPRGQECGASLSAMEGGSDTL